MRTNASRGPGGGDFFEEEEKEVREQPAGDEQCEQ